MKNQEKDEALHSGAAVEQQESINTDGVCQGIKAGASTVAGASLGVLGGIAGIAIVAAFEIVLPVSICLWAAGISGGAIGLLCGIDKKKAARDSGPDSVPEALRSGKV